MTFAVVPVTAVGASGKKCDDSDACASSLEMISEGCLARYSPSTKRSEPSRLALATLSPSCSPRFKKSPDVIQKRTDATRPNTIPLGIE